ncbi:MAG: glycoside hydrolase family 31 protein [Bacteroidetes bacterium]|nr:glycoside hydrolase family 31 protein [Bacteroidota bacterium]
MQPKTDKYSIKYFPDIIKNHRKHGNYFYFDTTETILEIRVQSDKIIRFRYAADGFFEKDFSYAVQENIQDNIISLDFVEYEDCFEIITSCITCQINKSDCKIKMFDNDSNLILDDELGFHWQHYLWKGGKIVYCSKKIQEGESFYGMGDKPTEFNLRGKRLENYGADVYGFKKDQDPLYKNVPFYMGLHHGIGYGIFFDNSYRTIFDFGKEQNETVSFWSRGGEMNYYFIYGPELMEVVKNYASLTGKPELPPLWSLGYHQCKWSYFPESKVKEITQEFRTRKIPCDAIYLDIDYMDGFRCFTWNKNYFPDPKRMVKELADEGFKTIVIIDPGIKVDNDYPVYQQAIAKDFFCKRADGALMIGDVWPGKCAFPDFTKPAVREWWAELFEGLVESGVRGVWNDMNEPAVFEIGTFPEDVRHDYDGNPCSHRKAHNVYGMQMARATHAGIKKFLMPHRPFVITRSLFSGAQRYSSVWTGDNQATWEHLWIANVQMQRLSVSGISFAGSDIGGFIGEPDAELYTRWIQLAVFHPFFRTHSAGNETTFEQAPWVFGSKYEFINRKFIQLRYHLLPYIYTTFWQHATEGTPMIRPLCYLDQHDVHTHNRMDEFGFGDHLLVCPVLEQFADKRKVYLPKGTWYYQWDDTVYHGGKEITAKAPIDKMPIFIKAGAVIPNYPKMQYVGEFELSELTLHVYFSPELTESVLYEDAGDNYGYKHGKYSVTKFMINGSRNNLVFRQTISGDFSTTYSHYKIIFHGLPFHCSGFMIDGRFHKLSKKNFAVGVVKIRVDKNFDEIILG